MKYIYKILLFAGVILTANSCYEDFIKDYDYTTAYCAFQYDLRTFVVGEGEKFDFTVCLAGQINKRDRAVNVSIADNLVTGNIAGILGVSGAGPFTAYDGMLGKAGFGNLSQGYVTDAVKAAGITSLKPLNPFYYDLEGIDNLVIKKGRNTAVVTVKAYEELFLDEKAIQPYYAIGFQIESADADRLPVEQSFEVIAVKYECKYYGNWYHGGKTTIVDDATGEVVSVNNYPLVLPQSDDKNYKLTTVGPHSVLTNKVGDKNGVIRLDFNGDNIVVTFPDDTRKIKSGNCYSNGAKLLQDREIHLDYSFSNGDGTTSIVQDVLTFRNRIRDGINEWQDENPENYK